jgi:hypothetical protein
MAYFFLHRIQVKLESLFLGGLVEVCQARPYPALAAFWVLRLLETENFF